VYAAGSHSDNFNKFIDGDISVDKTTGRVAVTYLDLPAKSIYLACYDNTGTRILTPTLVSAGAPFDTPTLTDGRIRQGTSDVVVIATRDFNAGAAAADGSAPTYTPPYNAWIGTATWDSFSVITITRSVTQGQSVSLAKQPRVARVLSQAQALTAALNVRVARALNVSQTQGVTLTSRRVTLLTLSSVQSTAALGVRRQVQQVVKVTAATGLGLLRGVRLSRSLAQSSSAAVIATPSSGVQYALSSSTQVHAQVSLATSIPSRVLLAVVWDTVLRQFTHA
jgi:hypothetical protein